VSSVEAERPALIINTWTHQVAATYLSSLTARESLSLENLSLETRRYADLFGEEFRAMPVVLRLVLNFIPYTGEHWFRRFHTFCCWWGGWGRGRVGGDLSRQEARWVRLGKTRGHSQTVSRASMCDHMRIYPIVAADYSQAREWLGAGQP